MMDFPVGPNETTTEWLTPVLQQHRALQRGRWKGESQPMKAMLLHEQCTIRDHSQPLTLAEVPDPVAYRDEVLIQVSACGVCHTELDEIEGRISPTKLPIALGHQVVGRVIASGHGVSTLREGDRVGVAWIFSACGDCQYCARDQENLCMNFRATGRDVDGGYAEFMKVPARYAYRLPDEFSDAEAAPLLCAGAIGYRSLRLTGLQDGQRLGLTGFGASAHLVLKMVLHRFPNTSVYVFARNPVERIFSTELGAVWAGDFTDRAPVALDAVIDTTPVWKPVVTALGSLAPGGRLVINAIRKEEHDKEYLRQLDYPRHLWLEKEIKSVANVTRADVSEFLTLAAEANIRPEVEEYPLEEANQALIDLKTRRIRGAKVLRI